MQVFAYVTNFINSTTMFHSIVTALSDLGIRVNVDRMINRYYTNIDTNKNIITWGVKIPLEWYKGRDKNILFCENGLLNQSASMTCDHVGLYDDSSVAKDLSKPSNEDIELLKTKVSDRFGIKLFSPYDKSGPILIAMQRTNDAPVRYHFTNDPLYNSWELSIKICREHLGGREVIIRSHPTDDPNIVHNSIKRFMSPNWTFIGNKGSIYDLIPTCRSMVVINSTVATEALIYGMPVATLGRGAFTNHGATLECSDDHSVLSRIDDIEPDQSKILGYLCSISRHEMPYDADVDTVMRHPSFKIWFDKMVVEFKDCMPSRKSSPHRSKRVSKDKFSNKIKRIRKSI